MTDAEILAWIEQYRPAISPQCNGGWVIELTHWGQDDGWEYEAARTRGTLRDAIITIAHQEG